MKKWRITIAVGHFPATLQRPNHYPVFAWREDGRSLNLAGHYENFFFYGTKEEVGRHFPKMNSEWGGGQVIHAFAKVVDEGDHLE